MASNYVGYLISLAAHSYRELKIGLDCANGASWMIAKSVFEALGETFVEVEKHVADTAQGLARLVVRKDGVLERRRLCVVDDGVDLVKLLFHSGLKSGQVMLGLDLVEGNDLEWGLILGQEWIGNVFSLLSALIAGSQGDDA